MNLLFDLDGTLADPMEAFAGSLDFAFDQLGIPRLPRAEIRTLIGPPLHLALPRLLREKAHLADEALRLYRQHHGEIGIYKYEFYRGMDAAIKTLGKDHRLFVATSKPRVYAEALLKFFGKSAYFEQIYGSELSGVNSKKGDLIRHAMTEQNLNPSETVMIGDREHDIIGANENKIASIGVLWGYGSLEELSKAGAGAIVSEWDELVRAIK
jgi:phosphoglycolate phosphatase